MTQEDAGAVTSNGRGVLDIGEAYSGLSRKLASEVRVLRMLLTMEVYVCSDQYVVVGVLVLGADKTDAAFAAPRIPDVSIATRPRTERRRRRDSPMSNVRQPV